MLTYADVYGTSVGMGVGNAGMTSLAATMLWMARDGSAMLGGLAFTAGQLLVYEALSY